MPDAVDRIDLPTPFPVGGVNAYYLDGPEPTLVDTGTRTDAADRALEKGLAGRRLGQLVVTHGHVDHFGLAHRLRERHGATVIVHEGDADVLRRFEEVSLRRAERHAEGLRRAGVPEETVGRMRKEAQRYDAWGEPVIVDRTIKGGDRLTLGQVEHEVLHAPGHTVGSVLLRSLEGAHTFTGDTVLERITPNALSVRPEDRDALPTYLATLRRLRDEELGTILPGHGAPFEGHAQTIRRALRHAELRQGRLAEALRGLGEATAYDLVGALFRDLPADQLFLAVSEVLGHLNHLRAAGRVRHVADRTAAIWRVADGGEAT